MIMLEVKEHLVEKKYEKIISDAQSESDSSISETQILLKKKEETLMKELREKFETEHKQKLEDLEQRGINNLEDSKQLAQSIDQNQNVDKAVDLVMEKIKNV